MKFLKNGDAWLLTPDGRMDIHDRLPPGNYTICRNAITGEYFLEVTPAFSLPRKLYGKTNQYSDRILATFNNRSPNAQIGVCLSGTKGSGKTLLAKQVAKESGLPVIIVNTPFSDERFMRTIQSIEQEAVIIFDEFEKLYDSDGQEAILTLFDGVFTARNKVMIITCNNKYSVKSFFHNRPTRLRYSIDFKGLEVDFIREYCEDVLDNCGAYLKKIITLSSLCEEFNFDMLQTLVDELNRYGGEIEDVVEILNVKPLSSKSSESWTLTVTTPNLKNKKWTTSDSTYSVSPLLMLSSSDWGEQICVNVDLDTSSEVIHNAKNGKRPALSATKRNKEDDYDLESKYFVLTQKNLYKLDPYSGIIGLRIEEDGVTYCFDFVKNKDGDNSLSRFDY